MTIKKETGYIRCIGTGEDEDNVAGGCVHRFRKGKDGRFRRLTGGEDLFSADAEVFPLVERAAVADGAGHQARRYLAGGLGERGCDGVGVTRFRVQVREGIITFAQGLGRNDADIGLVIDFRGLAGRQEDIAVVGEDEDGVGGDGIEGLDETLDGRIHGLAALDHFVGPEFFERAHEPGAGGHGHDAECLPALLEPFVHVVLVVLQGHVFHLDGQELAVLLAVVQDLARGMGMDMDLDDGAVAEEYQ